MYYARAKSPVTTAELAEAYLVNALVDLHRENWGVYGFRKLWVAARRTGLRVISTLTGRIEAAPGTTRSWDIACFRPAEGGNVTHRGKLPAVLPGPARCRDRGGGRQE